MLPNKIINLLSLFIMALTGLILLSCSGGGSGTNTNPPIDNVDNTNKGVLTRLNTEATLAVAKEPVAAFDSVGNGIAAWVSYDGDGAIVYASFYSAATQTWSVEERIGSVNFDVLVAPLVASNGTNFMLAWEQHGRVYATTYTIGQGWAEPTQLISDVSISQLALSHNSSGYALCWLADQVWALIYDDITGWESQPQRISSTIKGYAGAPSIASNGDGYLVAWTYQLEKNVYARVYENGAWVAEEAIGNAGGAAVSPKIASNKDNYQVIWTEENFSSSGVYAAAYQSPNWSAPTTVNELTAAIIRSVSIQSNGTGYAASWIQYGGTEPGISVAVNPTGSAWSSAASVYGYTTGNTLSGPNMVSNGSQYAVNWYERQTDIQNLYVSVFDSTNWSSAQSVGTTQAYTYDYTMTNRTTNYVTFWPDFDSNPPTIKSRTFNGTSWSSEVALVTNSKPGSVFYPKIVSASQKRFIAMWPQFHRGKWQLYAATMDGNSWSQPHLLAGSVYNIGNHNLLAASSDGAMVAWNELGGRLNSAHFNFTDGWSSATQIDTNEGINPQLISNGTGYLLTWGQAQPAPSSLYNLNSRISDGNAWLPADIIDADNSNGFLFRQQLASNGAGYAASWQRTNISSSGLAVAVYENNAWQTPDVIDPDGTYGNIAITSNGSGYGVSWNNTRVNVSLYNNGSWSTPEWLDNNTGNVSSTLSGHSIIGNSSGYMVHWLQNESPASLPYRAYVNIYSNAAWQGATPLETLQRITDIASSISPQNEYVLVMSRADNGSAQVHSLYGSAYTSQAWQAPLLIEDSSNDIRLASLKCGTTECAQAWWERSDSGYGMKIRIWRDSAWQDSVALEQTRNQTRDSAMAVSGDSFSVIWAEPVTPDTSCLDIWVRSGINFP